MKMEKSNFAQLDLLFNPHTVAVVGATNKIGKWGYDLMRVILKYRGERKVYPVNVTETEVLGVKAYKNINDIPEPVDFVVIVVPEMHVISVMQDCVKKGVRGAIVITAGFAELGEKGQEIQRELVRIAREGNIRMIGPNTMGHFSGTSGFSTLRYLSANKTDSGLSLISQSGNIGLYLMQRGLEEGIRFTKFVGTGNEADTTLEDYLEYFGQDDDTKVIVLYVEGLRQGRRFFELAREITRKKPIVALKVGRTEAGTRAARSHTSALSGSDVIYDAMFKQCGVIRVNEIAELFYTTIALRYQPLMKGNRVAVLTRGGGFGVLASDACQKSGLGLPTLSAVTLDKLDKMLPPYWSHGNPVDMVANQENTYSCVQALLDDDNVDAVYCVAVTDEGSIVSGVRLDDLDDLSSSQRENMKQALEQRHKSDIQDLEEVLINIRKTQKPVVFCASTPSKTLYKSDIYIKLLQHNYLVHPTPEDGARVLSCMARYSNYLRSLK